MEILSIKIDYEKAWTPDGFCSTFGFQKVEDTFIKTINGAEFKFKSIKSPDDLLEAQRVLRKGFGWKNIEIPPRHILALFEDTGGGCFSAFDEKGMMIGFAGGMGGGTDKVTGKPMLISSMLAMRGKVYRSTGIGKELKLIQAYYAKQSGYDSMKWLYDPERGENASLNMRKLGARGEEFWIDKYGRMASSVFGGMPTDRFRAVWRYTEPEVINRILGISKPPSLESLRGVPIATPANLPNAEKVLVEIDPNIDAIDGDGEKIKIRLSQREIFSYYFGARNYIASEFITSVEPDGRKSYYLLEPLKGGDIYGVK